MPSTTCLFRRRRIFSASVGLLFSIPALAVAAETINYDGSSLSLQDIIISYPPFLMQYEDAVAPVSSYSDNNVTLSGTGAKNVFGGVDNGTNNVERNRVVVTQGGIITGSAFGGYSSGGDAIGNVVTIDGGTVQTIEGGRSIGANAIGNRVIVNPGSTVGESILGGFSGLDATGNSVTINGGTLMGNVYGGASGTLIRGNDKAINNTVSIFGTPVLNGTLYGGYGSGLDSSDVRTGNTLNLHSAGLTAKGIRNFENYNFYLPSSLTSGQTMLTVTDGNGFGYPADLGTDARVNVGIAGGSTALAVGDRIVLIDSSAYGLTGTLASTTASGRGMQGVTLLYDFDLQILNGQLLATMYESTVNPQLKSLSEGRAASQAFVNQGSDLIIGLGMYSILASDQDGLVPFAAGSGGRSRYNTGSHVDVSGASMMTGVAWRHALNDGSLLTGVFFEAGWGGYDSHNAFSNAPSVKGDGDISYYGGGVLGRYDFAPVGPGNVYVDGSLRSGYVDTNFSSSDLTDREGRRADYDSGSVYYGAHAGLGYLWHLSKGQSGSCYPLSLDAPEQRHGKGRGRSHSLQYRGFAPLA